MAQSGPWTRQPAPGVESVDLGGVVLPDSRTGVMVDLGAAPPLAIVSVIRHRF